MRAIVKTMSEERVETLTQLLWVYKADAFLPHGCTKDGHAQQQPIWLTTKDDNPNLAKVLMLVDGAGSDQHTSYDLVCEIFDDTNQDAVENARVRWLDYKKLNVMLTYWQQSEQGWEKKN